MKICVINFSILLLIVLPNISYCQYLQKLYDIDSSNDWGVDIFIQPDSSYLIFGTKIYPIYHWGLFNTIISSDGNGINNKKIIQYNNCNLYMGACGSIKKIPTGGYLAPFSAYLDYGSGIQKSWCGLIKYNDIVDTIFLETYTDTAHNFENMYNCAVLPYGGYLVGGERNTNYSAYSSALIIRTDTFGDTIWTHTYQKYINQSAGINQLIPLADGRTVVGAYSRRNEGTGLNTYWAYDPWFFVIDSIGNILRDTLYSFGYKDGGFLYKDITGGYFTTGQLDILYGGDPNAMQSFPNFIAHLDTNFRTTWQTPFPYDSIYNSYTVSDYAIQLSNGSYIVIGDQSYDLGNWVNGWAAKISETGEILWSHYYNAGDTAHDVAFLRGVTEKPDGSLILVGCSHNDTLPTAWTNENLWLLGVDSNGCENSWCAPAEVKTIKQPLSNVLKVYPNPTFGSITLSATNTGKFILYTILGQQATEYVVNSGLTEVQLPTSLSDGIYIGKYVADDGSLKQEVRIVLEK